MKLCTGLCTVVLLSVVIILNIHFQATFASNDTKSINKPRQRKLHTPKYASPLRSSRDKRDVEDEETDEEEEEAGGRSRRSKQRKPNASPINQGSQNSDSRSSTPYLIRLAGGVHEYEGRVEVKRAQSDDTWGVVCDDFWDINDANVVCRQLGYHRGARAFHVGSQFGQGRGDYVLDNVQCAGNEAGLHLCQSEDWGTNNCELSSEVAGVTCHLNVYRTSAVDNHDSASDTPNAVNIEGALPAKTRVVVQVPRSMLPNWLVDLFGSSDSSSSSTSVAGSIVEPVAYSDRDSRECYTHIKGEDYRGTKSRTVRGKTCQAWSSNTPHVPNYTPQEFPNILGDHNYCRNVGDTDRVWCYTTDPQIRWDFCEIGEPQSVCNNPVANGPQELSALSRFAVYLNGALPDNNLQIHENVTPERCAELCQAEQSFVCRSYDYRTVDSFCSLSDKNSNDVTINFNVPGNPFNYYERIDIGSVSHFRLTPNAAISGHNVEEIRDVSLESCAHMCMVAEFGCASFDFARQTGQCWLSDVRVSESVSITDNFQENPYDYYERLGEAEPDCYTGNGYNYRGEVSYTTTGLRCFRWDDLAATGLAVGVTPETYPGTGLGNHNLCRNPDEDERPWCYFANEQTGQLEGWTYCAIRECPTRPAPPAPVPTTTRAPIRITSLSTNKPATQSSTGAEAEVSGPASNAVDGNPSSIFTAGSCTITNAESRPWWYVDLGQEYDISSIKIVNRRDYWKRLKRTDVRIGSDVNRLSRAAQCGRISHTMTQDAFNDPNNPDVVTITCTEPLRGRYVHIQRMTDINSKVRLTLCEVLVNGVEVEPPAPTLAPTLAPTTQAPVLTCRADQFQCADNSQCISTDQTCDLSPDCPDNSDEEGCPNPLDDFRIFADSSLPANLAEPEARYIQKSVPECAQHCATEMRFVCRSFDYITRSESCNLFSDTRASTGGLEYPVAGTTHYERESQTVDCVASDGVVSHPCSSGRCISIDWLCDGDNDCGDFGDEKNCGYEQYDIRLVDDRTPSDTTPLQGRVEVFYLGRWGIVCDDLWSIEDANVVCKELDYIRGATNAVQLAQFGSGSGLPILLDNVACQGSENSLRECTHAGWGVHNCLVSEAAGVECEPNERPTCASNEFQCVRDGRCISETIKCDGTQDCADNSDEVNCETCRPNQFRCDNLQCVDTSWKCDGTDDCGDGSDEVDCPIELRLEDGTNDLEGRIGLLFRNQWGTVCDDAFNNVAASVVCRQLGLGDTGVALRAPGGTGPIWLDDISCNGNEASILDCQHRSIGTHNCAHDEDVGVRCTGNAQTPQLPQPQVTPTPVECGIRTSPQAIVNTRIVGGSSAKPGSWPWQVQLKHKSSGHYCGATLIDHNHVISAAHCFQRYGKNHFQVRIGEHNLARREGREQTFDIECLHLHPRYDNGNTDNDIAILKLDGQVTFNNFVTPVCLTSPNEFPANKECWISGWGNTQDGRNPYPDILQEAKVPLLPRSTCTSRRVYGNKLTSNMLCAGYLAGGIDSCDGDSGGPLVCQNREGVWKLVGVTSWGYGCAQANAPGVYAQVQNYISWINQVRTSSRCP